MFSHPRGKLGCNLILKWLEVDSFQYLNRQRKAKVFHGKGRAVGWKMLKDVGEIQIFTPNWSDNTFVVVSVQPRNLSKLLQNFSKELHVILDGGEKNCGVIHIERGPNRHGLATNRMKLSMISGHLKDVVYRINGKHKKKRGERGPCLKPRPSLNGVPGTPLRKTCEKAEEKRVETEPQNPGGILGAEAMGLVN